MRWSATEFEELVGQALDDLPGWVRERMDNVSVMVAPWPTAHQLRAVEGRKGTMLLGLYEGVPLPKRSRRYHLAPPDRITLFQGPLERTAFEDQALLRLIRRTIIHEIAHHFGFSEAEIQALGY